MSAFGWRIPFGGLFWEGAAMTTVFRVLRQQRRRLDHPQAVPAPQHPERSFEAG
jgi:hypothetical protein